MWQTPKEIKEDEVIVELTAGSSQGISQWTLKKIKKEKKKLDIDPSLVIYYKCKLNKWEIKWKYIEESTRKPLLVMADGIH